MAIIKCNYYQKIGCEALSHDNKAVRSYWIDHAGRGMMQVYCCPECAKIVEAIEPTFGSAIIQNND